MLRIYPGRRADAVAVNEQRLGRLDHRGTDHPNPARSGRQRRHDQLRRRDLVFNHPVRCPGRSRQTVQQWLDTQQPAPGKTAAQTLAADAKTDPNFHTLRDLLVNDLAQRLNIPLDALQITFSAQDEKLLSLAEPLFKFDVLPSRARALGNVSWDVTVINDAPARK